MLDEALSLYETATFHPYSLAFSRLDTQRQPIHRLIALLERRDRLDEARRAALLYARHDAPSSSTDDLIHQARFVARREMARKLVELGDPAEAVPLLGEALLLANGIPADAPNYFDDTQSFARQAREGLETVLARLGPDDLAPIAGRSSPTRSPPGYRRRTPPARRLCSPSTSSGWSIPARSSGRPCAAWWPSRSPPAHPRSSPRSTSP